MFVSSFNTYISDINLKRTKQNTQETKNEGRYSSASNFEKKQQVLSSKVDIKTPINYISNYKSFANKQKLQEDKSKIQEQPTKKFSKINNITNAKTSYEANSKMFSLRRVPQIPIGQLQRKNESLPIKLQQKMVNTYIANDNYYKITA